MGVERGEKKMIREGKWRQQQREKGCDREKEGGGKKRGKKEKNREEGCFVWGEVFRRRGDLCCWSFTVIYIY